MPTAHLEHDNASPDTLRDAELIGALIFLARTVTAIEQPFPCGASSQVIATWCSSLIHHVVARFGGGVRLENEAIALGERLGIALEVQIAPVTPALVH